MKTWHMHGGVQILGTFLVDDFGTEFQVAPSKTIAESVADRSFACVVDRASWVHVAFLDDREGD